MGQKILFLDQFGNLGGGQRVLLNVLESLRSSGIEVSVALNGTGDFFKALTASGLTVTNLPLGGLRSGRKTVKDIFLFVVRTFYCSVLIIRSVLKENFALLYANGTRTFFCAAIAGRITGRPVIWHLHNVFASGKELRSLIFFSKWVSQIIVCSEAASTPLVKARPGLSSRIQVLYNPIPYEGICLNRQRALESLGKPALDPEFVSFGVLGRITPFKGQLEFVQAAKIALEEFPRVYFWVVGNPAPGCHEDLDYQNQVEGLVKSADIDSSVFLIPHCSDIERVYAVLDVVVLASQGPEALPMTLVEAMSLGKAIISPAQGGVKEMLEDEKTALLVDRARSSAIADKMLELIRNPEKRRSLGENARTRAKVQFSRERFGREIQTIVSEALHNPV